ncbi:MAG: tautomerase family protein [Nitratireductor sp.]
MPVIRVEMLEGRTLDQKRELVRMLTDAFVSACGARPDSVQVVLDEKAPFDWAVAGQLIPDREKS